MSQDPVVPVVPFGARLRAAMDGRGPLCVGIDPHPALLDAWGLADSVNGLEKFALGCAEALGAHVAAVKPQSAFFERFGSRGIAVLERVIEVCRETGALVVLDVKRGDIGSTAQAYADAYLDPRSPIAADAITASPFLGFATLLPMIATAREHGTGVFVLALTSNPEAPQFQHARTGDGATVAGTILEELRTLNEGVTPWGSFGAVIGATIAETAEDLAVNGPLLVPGIGAQGGTPDDVRRVLGEVIDQVLPSCSREILGAGPGTAALRGAADRTLEAFGTAGGRR